MLCSAGPLVWRVHLLYTLGLSSQHPDPLGQWPCPHSFTRLELSSQVSGQSCPHGFGQSCLCSSFVPEPYAELSWGWVPCPWLFWASFERWRQPHPEAPALCAERVSTTRMPTNFASCVLWRGSHCGLCHTWSCQSGTWAAKECATRIWEAEPSVWGNAG